jgi:hypothetical protein
MASSKSPGWAEWAFIVTLVLFLGVGLGWFLEARDKAERLAAQEKSKTDAATAQKAATSALEQVEALKKASGHTFEDVGAADPGKPNTVMNAITTEINTAAPDVAEKTYTAAIAKLTTDVKAITAERDDLRKKLDDLQEGFNALEDKYKLAKKEEEDARAAAERDLMAAVTSKSEELAKKDADIDELKKAYTEAQATADAEREQAEKKEKELTNKGKALRAQNQKLSDRLLDIERTSFEQPDGFIRLVDNKSNTVFINVGEADRLPLRATFSVYDQSVPGVARSVKDVKGQIEVVRLIGPRMAEARMVDSGSNLLNPLTPGDMIYSPLWSPGRSEKFAVIGAFDLDGDGVHDRELLHELVRTARAEIAVEVDALGNRKGPEITEDIKFLVVGKMPKLDDAADVEEQKQIERVNEQYTKLLEEARSHGVQIKSKNDFLAFCGYRPNNRLYRPGEDSKFNLRAGSRSASTDESSAAIRSSRVSSGQTSAAVSGDRSLPAKTSPGSRQKLFRSGGK